MKCEYGLKRVRRAADAIVTVGSFDGVHLGHRQILDHLISRAQACNAPSVVVSFDPHPREVISGHPMPLLSSVKERETLLDAIGLDRFIVLPFTREFSALSAENFVRSILVERIGMAEMIVGHDHGFGRGRSGNADLLRMMGDELGFSVYVVSAHLLDSGIVSSSTIRSQLHDGDVRGASRLLGRHYSIVAEVIRGDGRGHQMGYPTANLDVSPQRKVLPRRGVYAVLTALDHSVYGGMMNIGVRPTISSGAQIRVEVHLFDKSVDLYGRTVDVSIVERIRDEVKFAGLDELTVQLEKDERVCRDILNILPGTG